MAKEKHLNTNMMVRLPLPLKEALEEHSKKEGYSLSVCARLAFLAFLENLKKSA